MGGDHHEEPDFNFKEYPPIKRGLLLRSMDAVLDLVTGPVDFVREKVVKPNQKENYWYHRRFRRVPTIDQCYTDDLMCVYEANEQFRRDKLVEGNILTILRERMHECHLLNPLPHSQAENCGKVDADYKEAELNYFIKYGDQGYYADARTALAKQKHRIIWERRYGPVGQGRPSEKLSSGGDH